MALKKDDSLNLFDRFSNLMERNIKGVKIGCYSIAFIGLTIAMRRVRPFSRFKKPSDFPKRFIKERRELIGAVERIEPNGALLMINHKPIIALPIVKEGQLPVKVASVSVNGHGVSWLQTLVAGNEVTFVPVAKSKDFVECEVKMPQKTHDKKLRTIDLGESLVSIGFGTVIERPLNKKDPNYRYYMKLKAAEEAALKKKMGIKYYIKPTRLILESISLQLNRGLTYVTKKLITAVSNKSSKKVTPAVPKLTAT